MGREDNERRPFPPPAWFREGEMNSNSRNGAEKKEREG